MKRKFLFFLASNTLCDRTITFLPVLFEVSTAMCHLVREKKRGEGSAEAGLKTTSLTKRHTSDTTVAPYGPDQPQPEPTRRLD